MTESSEPAKRGSRSLLAKNSADLRFMRKTRRGNTFCHFAFAPCRDVIYERKDQAEIRIPLERIIFGLQTQKFNAFKTISASGRFNSHTGSAVS
jgi:hypothetical protein